MEFAPGSGFSIIAFIAVLVAICFSIIAGIGVVSERLEFSVNKEVFRACAILIIWLAIYSISLLGARPRVLPLGPSSLIFALVPPVILGLSSYGSRLALGLSIGTLVAFQVIRLPMQLILHQWVMQGTVPQSFSWTGGNWDITTGLLALAVAPLAEKHHWLAWVLNIFGIVMFINFLVILISASPVSAGIFVSPPLVIAYRLPYFLISPIYLGSIVTGHILLTRSLLYRSK